VERPAYGRTYGFRKSDGGERTGHGYLAKCWILFLEAGRRVEGAESPVMPPRMRALDERHLLQSTARADVWPGATEHPPLSKVASATCRWVANGCFATSNGRSAAFRHGSLVRERPLEGRGEGVKTHSALCRTEPLARGVAPATPVAPRPATGGRGAWPQDVAGAADTHPPTCESPEPKIVK